MHISLGYFVAIALVAVAPILTVACSAPEPIPKTPADAEPGAVLFTEDFEGDLGRWTFPLGSGHALVDRLDGSGRALELKTQNLPVYALIEGSEQWGDVRIEGELLFPDTTDNYLGYIYRYTDDGRRVDFGSLYIKGNDSYVQANPHFDTNVGRTLYPEFRSQLTGSSAIEIGAWQSFALEVVENEAHLYVGAASTPALALDLGAPSRGHFGFKPRIPGGAVQIDNLRVIAVDRLSRESTTVLARAYTPERWIADWHVLGPLSSYAHDVEAGNYNAERPVEVDGRRVAWRPYQADRRGAVVTGAITEHRGPGRVAYFRTVVEAESGGAAILKLSTVDAMAIWWNGEFLGYGPGLRAAWWDALQNEDHVPISARVKLEPGSNELLLRVVGGQYATGGFYAAVER